MTVRRVEAKVALHALLGQITIQIGDVTFAFGEDAGFDLASVYERMTGEDVSVVDVEVHGEPRKNAARSRLQARLPPRRP